MNISFSGLVFLDFSDIFLIIGKNPNLPNPILTNIVNKARANLSDFRCLI